MADKMASTAAVGTRTTVAKSVGHTASQPISDANNDPDQQQQLKQDRVVSYANNNKDAADSVSLSSPQSSYNSSYSSNSGHKLASQSVVSNSSLTSMGVPGGVVTTQNISTVIRPKENNNSLQFVKIQTPELSKKAVEQIRIAEETKVSKEKIKEVEEEWQNNLLNWKSKRRQQFGHTLSTEQNDPFDNDSAAGGRKIKTFAEMLEQRAKSGNQLGFNLQRYIKSGDDEDETPINNVSKQRQSGDEIDCLTPTADGNTNCIAADDETQHRETCCKSNDNRFDSDCEAHSSTSSGYNQTSTSKSPGSPDSFDVGQHRPERYPAQNCHPSRPSLSLDKGIIQVDDSKPVTQTCDKNNLNRSLVGNINSSFSLDERDHEPSLSIVNHLETDRLNSTLKQGLCEPPTQSLPPSDLSRVGLATKITDTNVKFRNDSASKISQQQNDDSENSAYEEEDEEEREQDKEQRQLQRIAFVAKLKAFENLTKPTTQAPKFIPTAKQAGKLLSNQARSVSVEQNNALKSSTKSLQVHTQSSYDEASHCHPDEPKQERQINTEPVSSVIAPRAVISSTNFKSLDLKNNNNNNNNIAISRKPIPLADDIKVSTTDKSSPMLTSDEENFVPCGILSQVVSGGNLVDESHSPSVSTSSMESPPAQTRFRHLEEELESSPIGIGDGISNIDLNCPLSKSSLLSAHEPASTVRVTNNNDDINTKFSNADSNKLNGAQFYSKQQTASPKQVVVSPSDSQSSNRCKYSVSHLQKQRPIESLNEHSHQTSYVMQNEEQRTSTQGNIPSSTNLLATSRGHYHKVMPQPNACPRQNQAPQSIQKQSRNVDAGNQSGPQQQPTLKQSSQPLPHQASPKKHQVKDNKERTVLSVSGKKRCSSCKEELGRGAAAFVVESLSLVYHTNCFRCSVCHVNLSNGFRGVDVRVHAGALHCQNCYSKDGLNYSRV